MSFKKLKAVVSLYLALLMALPAHAAGPFIWGADNRAQGLQQNGAVFSNGQPIDYNGEINKIGNNEAIIDTSGWTTYADAAGTTPVDCTGGSPTLTWTRNTSSPLRGSADFLATKDAANRQGEGVAYAFSIDSADTSKPISIAFDVKGSANYAANDMAVYIYDVTNGVLINPASPNIAQSSYRYQSTFLASTSTSYRLCLHVASTNATAYTVQYDNFVVGPNLPALGVPVDARNISSLMGYSAGFGTIPNSFAYMQRVGNVAKIWGGFLTGTLSSTTAYIQLPSGMNIDTTAIPNYTQKNKVGTAAVLRVSGSQSIYGDGNAADLFFDGTITNQLFFAAKTGASTSQYEKIAANALNGANGYFVSYIIELPIAEWAGSSAYLSQAQPEYVYNTSTASTNDATSFGYGPQGNLVGSITSEIIRRVRFLTPIQATDNIVVEVDPGGEGNFYPVAQSAIASSSGSALIAPYQIQNGVSYGMGYVRKVSGSSTDVDIGFGAYRYPSGATYGAAGSAWSGLANARWRVVKIPGQISASAATLPSGMTPSQATALGYYIYSHGTTYNGGNAPTVAYNGGGGSLSSVDLADFIPYQMSNGTWRMKFNIVVTVTSTSRTGLSLTVAGVSFPPVNQAISAAVGTSAGYMSLPYVTNPNLFGVDHASATATGYRFSGDVKLASKPTWAY